MVRRYGNSYFFIGYIGVYRTLFSKENIAGLFIQKLEGLKILTCYADR